MLVSLAEIDKWIVETYPKLNNNSSSPWHFSESACGCEALMRAYKSSKLDKDSYVTKREFRVFVEVSPHSLNIVGNCCEWKV